MMNKCAVESQTLLTSCVAFFLYWYKDNVSLCLKYVEIKERDSYEKLYHFPALIDTHVR